MGRKVRIGFIAFGFIVLGFTTWIIFFARSETLSYQGRNLEAWLNEFDPAKLQDAPATKAIDHFGGDAAPTLIRYLRARESGLDTRLRRWLSQQDRFKLKVQYQPATISHRQALTASCYLGTKVKSTVPALIALVDDYPRTVTNISTARFALEVLAAMGPEGIRGIVHCLRHKNPSIQVWCAELLGTAPGAASPEVLAGLAALTNSTNPALTAAASQSLRLISTRNAQKPSLSALAWEISNTNAATGGSVWEFGPGFRVLQHSGLYGGFRVEDIFGTHMGTLASGHIVFQESKPDGFVHFVEWQTPAPVTVRSFGVLNHHSPATHDFSRAFRAIILYAWNDESNSFYPVYTEQFSVPYGHALCSTVLFAFRNLEKPATSSRFRAEFIQNGSGRESGPRLVRLLGYSERLNLPTVRASLQDPELFPIIKQDLSRLLDEAVNQSN